MDNNKPTKAKTNKFWSNIKYDLEGMFVVKPWNICTILLLVPGILIGLFMGSHIQAIYKLPSGYELTSFYLFLLILLGCISIFSGFSFASRRSVFNCVFTITVSILMVLMSVLYVVAFFSAGKASDSNAILSIICIGISVLCSLGGAILTAFFIDKKIEKE